MKIEFLYFEGCPHYEPTLNLLNKVLKEERIKASMEQINVDSEELVQKHRFLGSPSIRIEGKDIEIEARTLSDFGQKCRIYPDDGARSGVPPASLIRKGILEAKKVYPCCG